MYLVSYQLEVGEKQTKQQLLTTTLDNLEQQIFDQVNLPLLEPRPLVNISNIKTEPIEVNPSPTKNYT